MKRNIFLVTVLASLIMIFQIKEINASQIDVDVVIEPVASYRMSQLYDAVMGNSNTWSIDGIAMLQLTNKTEQLKKLKIRVKLYSNKISSTKPLIDYTTSYDHFPIDLEPGETLIINTKNPEYITGGTLRSDRSEIKNKIRSAYGDNPLNYSGWIPEDTYRYEILVFNKDDNETYEGSAIGRTSESIFIPQHSHNISIIQPATKMVVEENPVFIWESLDVRAGVDITYKVQLYEIDHFGDADYKKKVFEEEDVVATTITYSGNKSLRKGTVYALHVNAIDETIGAITSSTPVEFRYGNLTLPEIINDDIKALGFPIILSWTTPDINNEFKVIISEDKNGNRVIFEDIINNRSQYELSYNESIQPGKKYYWQILQREPDTQNFIKDDKFGKFSLEQTIDIISPKNNEVIEDETMITFFWDGNESSQYILKISHSRGMEYFTPFIVNGTKKEIFIKDIDLIRNSTHYWTVKEIDEFGNEWGKQPNPGTFKLPALDAPKIIFPKNNIIFDDVMFSFQTLRWADSYRLDIFDRDDNVVHSKETYESFLKLNLVEISNFIPENDYTWKITAISEDFNDSVTSSAGKFKYRARYTTNTYNDEDNGSSNENGNIKMIRNGNGIDIKNNNEVNKETEETKTSNNKKIRYGIELIKQPEFLTPSAVISWKRIDEEGVTYEIHLSNDIEFKNPKIVPLDKPMYAIERVDEFKSDLFYKIVILDSEKRKLDISKIFKISISDVDVLYEDIMIIYPKDKLTKELKRSFFWIPELKDATLLISTRKNMKDAEQFLVSGDGINFDDIKYDFKYGVTYFWTIQKENHKSNMINKFILVPGDISLIQPFNQEVVGKNLVFQWVADTGFSYKLLISKDDNFKDILEEIDTDKLEHRYVLNETGRFFWKVKQLDNDKKVIQESDVSWVERKEVQGSFDINLRKNLEYFIKQNLDNDNKIKVDEWKLTRIQTIGNNPVTEDDLRYLLDNKKDLLRITQ
tara:strand:- start:334 stop:3270 length:2937 start_codon:yes stop_codon:yes gene_type:complete